MEVVEEAETETKSERPLSHLPLRGAIGGLLMGLANLVPGISGGTMLLATGVYPEFIGAVAEISTFRFRSRSLVLLASVVGLAGTAILLFAGPAKNMVVDHRWMMYSLFIGLTLGGVPIVWRLARPLDAKVVCGAVAGMGLMVAMALTDPAGGGDGGGATFLLFIAGMAGASAMILPGVSGGYLLLLLGQYLPILGAIDKLKQGLLGPSLDYDLILEGLEVAIPVGLGLVAGVVGVSNLLRWALRRHRKPTLGVLLGLLLGAALGLWPFQETTTPEPGQTIRGLVVTEENLSGIEREHWPTRQFRPSLAQLGTAFGLVAAGFAATTLIGQLDRRDRSL